jgi:hypothetical protein
MTDEQKNLIDLFKSPETFDVAVELFIGYEDFTSEEQYEVLKEVFSPFIKNNDREFNIAESIFRLFLVRGNPKIFEALDYSLSYFQDVVEDEIVQLNNSLFHVMNNSEFQFRRLKYRLSLLRIYLDITKNSYEKN